MVETTPIEALRKVMRALRDKETGCPWDIEQTSQTIAPHTLEEAFEVIEAIENNDAAAMEDELGDLLFNVIYHAQLAEEQGVFDFDDIARKAADKMIRRHPHVFGDEEVGSVVEQKKRWEAIKAQERGTTNEVSIVADLPLPLPALMSAQKTGKRVSGVGFDWPDSCAVVEKIEEELAELKHALASGDKACIEDELGDVLYSVVNLARHQRIDAETALRGANRKFLRRFRVVETLAREENIDLQAASIDTLEELWARAKKFTK